MGRSGLVGRELVPHPWECEFKPRIHGVPKEDLSQNNWEAGTTLAKLWTVDVLATLYHLVPRPKKQACSIHACPMRHDWLDRHLLAFIT